MNALSPPPRESARGRVTGLTPEGLAAVRTHVLEHDLDFAELPEGLEVRYGGGLARIDRGSLSVEAPDAGSLHVMQEVVAHLLDSAAAVPVWDIVKEGSLPPNLRLVRVDSVRDLSPGFRRVRVTGDISRFAASGLHFRLLLPPEDRPPVWPRIDATGRTRWPDGEDKLHNPVYTVRALNPEDGWLEFDVFLHHGGIVTDWTTRVEAGATVGLIGPGGGGVPEADWIALFGDETALPAIARILAALPSTTTGSATIRLGNRDDRQALTHPPGMDLRWIGGGASLVEAFEATPLPEGSRHVWFAGEEAEVEAVRTRMRDRGLGRKEMLAARYWTAPARRS